MIKTGTEFYKWFINKNNSFKSSFTKRNSYKIIMPKTFPLIIHTEELSKNNRHNIIETLKENNITENCLE